jgi:hypothetical protein
MTSLRPPGGPGPIFTCRQAADPPDDTIHLVMMPRGSGGKWQMLNVQNWSSSGHVIVPQFNDHDNHADYWVCPGGK